MKIEQGINPNCSESTYILKTEDFEQYEEEIMQILRDAVMEYGEEEDKLKTNEEIVEENFSIGNMENTGVTEIHSEELQSVGELDNFLTSKGIKYNVLDH